QVYTPIERMRAADDAVQRGDRDDELIPDDEIRSDEMGEIMRSRNASIVKLRDQETRLGEALDEIERVATELNRKNHMLETAKRNIADQDRLASLGMMSAGIAHELNTPLSVLKGCTEELRASNAPPEAKRVELMLRVLSRLERLSDSLTDFARARPPATDTVELGPLLDEAWTLVSLDRNARNALVRNEIPPGTAVTGDGDRLVQVFVNLLRNAVDASEDVSALVVDITAQTQRRDEARWVSITIADNGPGIEPAMLPRLFEPFATTRLDARGSGLGLAVAEGIVKEHDGVILARNRVSPLSGAEFEVVLPADTPVRAAERTDAARGYHDSEKTGTTNTPGPLRGAP
ncbi:MAG: HAMP domain-containing sensor histidine kinase, partial [Planctomycetota bacterium]